MKIFDRIKYHDGHNLAVDIVRLPPFVYIKNMIFEEFILKPDVFSDGDVPDRSPFIRDGHVKRPGPREVFEGQARIVVGEHLMCPQPGLLSLKVDRGKGLLPSRGLEFREPV